jgi:hypothetical protein
MPAKVHKFPKISMKKLRYFFKKGETSIKQIRGFMARPIGAWLNR